MNSGSSRTHWAFHAPHSRIPPCSSELLEEVAPLTFVQNQLRHGPAETTLQKHGHVVNSQCSAFNTPAEELERYAVESWSQAPT